MRGNLILNAIRNHTPMVMLLCAVSCATTQRAAPQNVGRAWQEQEDTPAVEVVGIQEHQTTGRRSENIDTVATDPIVSVNGHPIAKGRVINLLLRGHGPAVVEQLAVLDMAERLAAQRGLSITAEAIERERGYALKRLVNPQAGIPSQQFDREEAERVLAIVLARRNISREEFHITIRRNATLRRIVESEQDITESLLRNEYARLYGKSVEALNIQPATAVEQVSFESVRADLERRVRRRLAERAMQSLHQKLFRSANIEVYHPALQEALRRMEED